MSTLEASNMAMEVARPRRPGYGSKGTQICVICNVFEMTKFPDRDVYQYRVDIMPEVPTAVNRRIMEALYAMAPDRFDQRRVAPAYDGQNILYTATKLPLDGGDAPLELRVSLKQSDGKGKDEEFVVMLKETTVVHMQALHEYLSGSRDRKKGVALDVPRDTLAALDIIMRTVPAMRADAVAGQSFYNRTNPRPEPLDAKSELWFGFHQSLRPGQGRLFLNVDLVASAFVKSGPLLERVAEALDCRENDLSRVQADKRTVQTLSKELVGLKIRVTHRDKQKRAYRIEAVSFSTALTHKFQVEEKDGSQGKLMSVAEYFDQRYGFRLRMADLPLVEVGKPEKRIHLPIECCEIVGGARVTKMTAAQTSGLVKKLAIKPHERTRKIEAAVQMRDVGSDPLVSAYGIQVGPQMTTLEARILPSPAIVCTDGRGQTLQPQMGVWQMRDIRSFVSPQSLGVWTVLVLGGARIQDNQVGQFCSMLAQTAQGVGSQCSRPSSVYFQRRNESIQEAVRNAAVDKIQLMLIILPAKDTDLYTEAKYACETVYDIRSQCCLSKHVFKPNRQYCSNIWLKINVKLGGVNTYIDRHPSLDFFSEVPACIMGADVTHAGPGSKLPSIAAVVCSVDRRAYQYAAETRAQPSRVEIIQDLKAMVRQHLLTFYNATQGKKPQRILFYRDGVGEGQFAAVLMHELRALQEACAELEADYKPRITYVVVQKRHHIRFFPGRNTKSDRSGNVPAGTVVDTSITTPSAFDFYLVAHGGIQGTSRPTHYQVLYDENDFTADGLQELTNRLCYTYARCTRSVSLVPAAYYAHLVAARARCHANPSNAADLKRVMPRNSQSMFYI